MKDMYSSRLAIIFSCVGHAFMHILVSLFLTIVLALEREWDLSYDALIEIWALGAFLIGAGAPLAGWLSDRYGEVWLMVAFFVGAGMATVFAGLADGSMELLIALSALGLCAAIYHPVGLAWVVKNAVGRGKVLGIVGISGSIGLAVASLLAGSLTDLSGWRSAFVAPGVAAIAVGGVLAWLAITGRVVDRKTDLAPAADEAKIDLIRAFGILLLTMVLGSLYYTAFATVLPKWISVGISPGETLDTATVGMLVTIIYLVGATGQIAGGWLADRYALKWVYALTFAIKIPMTLLAIGIGGWSLFLVAIVIGFTLDLSGPVENILLARYSPQRRRGLIYGLKYVAGFAAAPLGIAFVAWCYRWSDGPEALYLGLAALALLMLIGALFLPNDRPNVVTAPATAGS